MQAFQGMAGGRTPAQIARAMVRDSEDEEGAGAGFDSSVAAESKEEENENGGAMVPMKTHDEVGADGKLVVDDVALLLINDAIQRETSMYYIDDKGVAQSVWQDGKVARRVGLLFRNPYTVRLLSSLAFFDMILAVFAPPGVLGWPDWVADTSIYLQIGIWIFTAGLCLVRMKYMMHKIGLNPINWFKSGAAEPPWVMVQFTLLFVLTTVEWAIFYSEGTTDILQAGGEIMKCPPASSVFIHGWARAWIFIYFNAGVRDALQTLIKVFSKLFPIFALLLSSYLGHFFVVQGLAVGVEPKGANGFGPGGDLGDAMWNFFGLLTTVNHPDVLMHIVDDKWYTYFLILAYMFLTNIIMLNLLLAIVCGEYAEVLGERRDAKAKLRSTMLDTAFDRLAIGDHITMNLMTRILRKCAKGKETKDDFDHIEMIVRLIDVDMDAEEGAPAVQDHQIDRQDLHELIVFYTSPINRKPMTQCEYCYELKKDELLAKVEANAPDAEACKAEIARMEEVGVRMWAATFPTIYNWTAKVGAKFPPKNKILKKIHPYYDASALQQIHCYYFLFYLFWCLNSSSEAKVSETDAYLLLFSCVMQSIFVVFCFLGEMRNMNFAGQIYYFNMAGKRAYANWSNFLLLVCLWFEFASGCASEGCFSSKVKDDSHLEMIAATSVGKIMQVLNFAFETPSVLLLIKAIIKTIPTLLPHFGLFLAIYYGFSGMAISFFCGKCLQANSVGGPGYWGQLDNIPGNMPTTGLTPATGVPWADTDYGGNPFYYNLNYDGFPHALMSLYVIMIQNNWNVAADGPIQTTKKQYRWFFFVYCIFVAWVMINVLVGAIIDALSMVREESLNELKGIRDPLEVAVDERMDATTAPSGKKYSYHWELGDIPLEGEVRNDAQLCEGLLDDGSSPEADAVANLRQENKWLKDKNDEMEKTISELKDALGLNEGSDTLYGQVTKMFNGERHQQCGARFC